MRVWAARGQTPVLHVDPGRALTHFYGTLNLHTGQDIVMRTPTMNAATTAQHLTQILLAIPRRPILLLWDKAPWHFGEPIRQVLAANPRLEILYFPTAAPDLNPQEQVWKAVRSAISHNHACATLEKLAQGFEQHLISHTFPSAFLDLYGFNAISPMFI